ncbi:MAG: ankyrin repeat domain-containing protein [Planctomycetia bacterium]|nr:ankyrin repeat domain-containing protein [Planctomycetia bacterium]
MDKIRVILFLFFVSIVSGCFTAEESSGRIEDLPAEEQKEMKERVERLYHVAQSGDTNMVKELLAQGVLVNTPCEYDKTALHVAAENNHPEICRLLLDAGALARPTKTGKKQHLNPPLMDQDGMTPADYGVFHVEVLKVFLDAGVPLESRGYMGLTLLQVAVAYDCVDSARLLIDRGANIHVKTPAMPPFGSDHGQNLLDLAESPEMQEMLKKAGVKESKKK